MRGALWFGSVQSTFFFFIRNKFPTALRLGSGKLQGHFQFFKSGNLATARCLGRAEPVGEAAVEAVHGEHDEHQCWQ